MSDELAKLLRESPFATLTEAVGFLRWYTTHDYRSSWDDSKCDAACEIVERLIQEAKERRQKAGA